MPRPGVRRPLPLAVGLALLLSACGGGPSVTPTPSVGGEASAPPAATVVPTSAIGPILPAPDFSSRLYPPNPAAIVVAIEAGHGGCLDWGVPDPLERGEAFAEKAITLAIARAMAARLESEGVTAVQIRDDDIALAGDRYPELGCTGDAWRDVNGDGLAGFGPDVPEGTRTRDELQARLDLANLVRADALVSIHIDSVTDDAGTPLPVARTETFFTDETPWGTPITRELAAAVQAEVVAALDAVAPYERQDRGTNAHNLYIVAPPLFEPTAERPDARRQPTRGALMPAILVEVGSITLAAEHDLLLSEAGQAAVADALLAGLTRWLGRRELAARIEPIDGGPGTVPKPVRGEGPPFWPPTLAAPVGGAAPLALRLTNTGVSPWPAGLHLVVGWQASDQPYLAAPPAELAPLPVEVPPLAPGESVEVRLTLRPPGGRRVAWLTLGGRDETFAELGSPPLQLATRAP